MGARQLVDEVARSKLPAPELGSLQQLVDVFEVTHQAGRARGGSGLIVRNPAGFSVELMIDRALDIGWADAAGIPVAWRSPLGRVAGVFHEPSGTEWIRTFGGGLLTTCGLASTGSPSDIDGVHFGLHGRIGHAPAQQVTWEINENDDLGLIVEVKGTVTEAALGQPTLVLIRTIQLAVSKPIIRINDTVTNTSYEPAGHMFRHHFNLGHPLVSGTAELAVQCERYVNRDSQVASSGPMNLKLAVADKPGPEQVWSCFQDQGESVSVVLSQPDNRAQLILKYGGSGFDRLIVWRNASPGVNVLGIEPSTSDDSGRLNAQQQGDLIWLAPGETRTYHSEIELTKF